MRQPRNNFVEDQRPIVLDVDEVQEAAIAEDFTSEVSVPEIIIEEPDDTGFDFTICFVGDINLDENWCTTQYMSAQPNGIYDCISEDLVGFMKDADIMCLNNEFSYSAQGRPLEGKAYTFRANPERVEVLQKLGIDAVTLANNHVYDYGKEAMLDTFVVLEDVGIPYFGAGDTLQRAMEPLYLEVDGKTIALAAASRAEKYKMTPQAADMEPGILRCYDTELFLQVIKEAKEHIPAVQSGCQTTYASEFDEQRRIFDFLESISVNVEISDEGIVTIFDDGITYTS